MAGRKWRVFSNTVLQHGIFMKSSNGLRQQERGNTRNEELSQPAAAPYLLGAL